MTRDVPHHPALVSSTIGIAIAVGVLVMVLDNDTSIEPLAVLACGLGVLAGSTGLRRCGFRVIGFGGSVFGGLVALVPLWLYAREDIPELILLTAVFGVVGTIILTIGLLPTDGPGSRLLVKLGTGGLFVAVLLAAVGDVSDRAILLAGIGTILVWDAAEHAINVGEHLGTTAGTVSIELIHVAASSAIGAGALVLVLVFTQITPGDLSLVQFMGVLGTIVLFTLALHE